MKNGVKRNHENGWRLSTGRCWIGESMNMTRVPACRTLAPRAPRVRSSSSCHRPRATSGTRGRGCAPPARSSGAVRRATHGVSGSRASAGGRPSSRRQPTLSSHSCAGGRGRKRLSKARAGLGSDLRRITVGLGDERTTLLAAHDSSEWTVQSLDHPRCVAALAVRSTTMSSVCPVVVDVDVTSSFPCASLVP